MITSITGLFQLHGFPFHLCAKKPGPHQSSISTVHQFALKQSGCRPRHAEYIALQWFSNHILTTDALLKLRVLTNAYRGDVY